MNCRYLSTHRSAACSRSLCLEEARGLRHTIKSQFIWHALLGKSGIYIFRFSWAIPAGGGEKRTNQSEGCYGWRNTGTEGVTGCFTTNTRCLSQTRLGHNKKSLLWSHSLRFVADSRKVRFTSKDNLRLCLKTMAKPSEVQAQRVIISRCISILMCHGDSRWKFVTRLWRV